MSHDAQHRPPCPLEADAQLLRAKLRALQYHYQGEVLSCADCGQRTRLQMTWNLMDNDWRVACAGCGHANARTYADPIRALLTWNAAQIERAQLGIAPPAEAVAAVPDSPDCLRGTP